MRISQRAFDMTVAEEVTSKAFYNRNYVHPEWPGLASGVTVGIGYDLGQCSRDKIKADFGALVPSDMLLVMLSCAGITGQAAKQKCAEVRSRITIPWDIAIKVFADRDVPSWTSDVLAKVPGADKLTPSCLGVLFDIAYNRGNAWNMGDDRHREMRAIRDHVRVNRLELVPGDIESMKRLWPNTVGLRRRCDHRIALWNEGLKEKAGTIVEAQVAPTPPVPDPSVPLNEGPARTKPPVTSNTQNGTTGVVVAGGTAATVEAYRKGMISTEAAIFIGFLVLLAAATMWTVWYRRRNPK